MSPGSRRVPDLKCVVTAELERMSCVLASLFSTQRKKAAHISDHLITLLFSTHPDVIVIFESFLHVIEELQDVQPLQAAVQQSVHTLERCLTHIQTIVHCVFERTHLHLQRTRRITHLRTYQDINIRQKRLQPTHFSDEVLPDLGLLIEVRQNCC